MIIFIVYNVIEVKKLIDIIIIGGGTAGLTAAIYSARAGKTVTVLEGNIFGGQIVSSPHVENYPGIKKISGADFSFALYEQAAELGVSFANKKVTGIKENGKTKVVTTENEIFECKAVIIATGAKNRALGLEREEQLIGKGVSYCATCDGAFYKNKEVAVVGGGNTALEDTAFLAEYCEKVYLIHRRDKFRGEQKTVDMLLAKANVQIVTDAVVTKLVGGEVLEAIEISNLKTNEVKTVSVSGVFVAIGQIPQNEPFSKLVELDSTGYVVAGEDCKTKAEGIFVAGDCRTKSVRQLSTAASDGTVAALAACEFIISHF